MNVWSVRIVLHLDESAEAQHIQGGFQERILERINRRTVRYGAVIVAEYYDILVFGTVVNDMTIIRRERILELLDLAPLGSTVYIVDQEQFVGAGAGDCDVAVDAGEGISEVDG